MEQIVSTYLKHLNIPVPKSWCEKQIRSHPDYPSLLSISDTLERLGIRHQAARIPIEQTRHLTLPYLFQVNDQSEGLKLIKNERDRQDIENREKSEASHAVVLWAKPTEAITDAETQERVKDEKFYRICRIFLLVSVAGFFGVSFIQAFSWIAVGLFGTALFGLIAGYFLLSKELGIQYNAVESFCNAGKRTNCDAVLTSEEARPRILGGRLTFSDVVVSYFTFQLFVAGLLLPFIDSATSFLVVLSVFSACTLPVVCYSLYVQAVKLKMWCRLCLIVDGILLLQAAFFAFLFVSGSLQAGEFEVLSVIVAALLFVITSATVILLKNNLEHSVKTEQEEIVANRIRYSPGVFTHLLFQEEKVDTTPFEKELVIGSRPAPVQILMAGSLGCGPCKDGFEKAVQIIEAYPEKANLTIRFNHGRAVENDQTAPSPGEAILRYWIQKIAGKANHSEKTEKLIRDWYLLTDLDLFLDRYPVELNGENRTVKSLIRQQNEWFENEEITRTPTFFINGYPLPKNYRIKDILALVPGLADLFQRKMSTQTREEAVS